MPTIAIGAGLETLMPFVSGTLLPPSPFGIWAPAAAWPFPGLGVSAAMLFCLVGNRV